MSKAQTEECAQKSWSFLKKIEMLIPGSNTHFLEVSAHVSLKVATKGSSRGEKVWKFSIFKDFYLKQKRRSATKNNKVSFMNLAFNLFSYFTSGSSCIATEAFRGCRKLWKFRFSCYFTKAKTEQCNQKDLFVFNKFGISIHCSATYFLRVGASVSLKVATKVSFRGTKIQKFSIFRAFFRKQKWRSAIDRIDLSLKNFLK